ncbi:GDP-mannose 4,6-dehydratase [Ancylobacter sp. 6x-1]|uniref:GDP-mannose 4,6-dehydratase n=1 Tax=Ancylobacter crimeensis TaxID=2579147 RepID=A0ABT0D948_9HYPH|nr:GDP-mannose 4,6-dehydratase [Ancylobacter crimeensis]
MVKTALITGITGQDGPYLAKLLIEKGYRVYGTYRRSSILSFWRLEYLGLLDHERLHLLNHDLIDSGGAMRLLARCEPDEVYNLAAQTFVGSSFDQPTQTAEITGIGPLHMLEAIRTINPKIRFYQASSAEMFGKVQATPQDETTSFYPRSPYGVSKLFAHWMTINYRESYGIFGGIGILFNHESPLRGEEFVTRKITKTVAAIAQGAPATLALGNLDARRDWGYAADYVRGIWSILQADEPDTFVIATSKTASVREFASLAFDLAGLPLEWVGSGLDERGLCRKTGRVLVRIDPAFIRPAEVDMLLGDASKAERVLGWRHTTSMQELCAIMLEADMQRERRTSRLRAEPELERVSSERVRSFA